LKQKLTIFTKNENKIKCTWNRFAGVGVIFTKDGPNAFQFCWRWSKFVRVLAEMEQSPSSVLAVGIDLAEMGQANINVAGDGGTFGGRRDRASLS